MNDLQQLIITVGFVAAVTVIISLFTRRVMKQVWEGKLVDKKVRSSYDEQGMTHTTYVLIFLTQAGKKKKIKVHKAVFDTWTVGDAAKKEAGKWLPEKQNE